MASCPNCSEEIQGDFGLVTCGSCGASVFIEMDGSIRNAEELPLEVTDDATESYDSQDSPEANNDVLDDSFSFSEPSPEMQELEVSNDEKLVAEVQEIVVPENQEEAPQHEVTVTGYLAQELIEPAPQNAIEVPDDFGKELLESHYEEDEENSSVDEVTKTPADSTEEAMQNITEFGNSSLSNAEEGVYQYTLRIDGIDSSDIKNHIYSSLANPRLNLNADEIIETLRNGHLTVRELSPVKAFVVINDIKGLPVEIFWEQHDITL